MERQELDDWFPVVRRSRIGRSDDNYTFDREAMGTPIRAQRPYAFVNHLVYQNQFAILLEDTDPFYRGDVCFSCHAFSILADPLVGY